MVDTQDVCTPGAWHDGVTTCASSRAAADHDDVIYHSEPVPAARRSDGMEGAILRFRGAGSAPAAIADEDDAGRPARLGCEEDRTCREPSCLHPTDSDDGRADESVPVVQVERQRDVLTVMAEKIASELRSRRRPVNSTRKVELRFGHSVRVADAPS